MEIIDEKYIKDETVNREVKETNNNINLLYIALLMTQQTQSIYTFSKKNVSMSLQ